MATVDCTAGTKSLVSELDIKRFVNCFNVLKTKFKLNLSVAEHVYQGEHSYGFLLISTDL